MNFILLRRWFQRMLTLDTLLIAALLILQALRLSPHYTPEAVALAFREIAWPLILWLALLLLGFRLHFAPAQRTPLCAANISSPLRYRKAFRISLFTAALVLIVLGISNQGLRDVLYKAIQICTECIGLG